MSNRWSGPPAAPCLVMDAPGVADRPWPLTLVPIVEVPSGTSGPWIALAEPEGGDLADVAVQCLGQAMAQDAISAMTQGGPPPGTLGVDWHLANTKVATADGAWLYFSPATVCWCDQSGAPRYDCDQFLRPAEDMLDVSEPALSNYGFVVDERLAGDRDRAAI